MIILALMLIVAPADAPAAPAQSKGIDFSQMPIEDAVQTMFMLISKDAREDTREMLSEMQDARTKRSALREAAQEMAQEMVRLKALSRDSSDPPSSPVLVDQIAWANELPTLCGKLAGSDRERCIEEQIRRRTSQLRRTQTRR